MSNVLALNGEIAPAPTVGALQRGVLRRPVELTGAKRTLTDRCSAVSRVHTAPALWGFHLISKPHKWPWESLTGVALIPLPPQNGRTGGISDFRFVRLEGAILMTLALG